MIEDTLAFPSDEELDVRRPIEDGTIAKVAVRKNKDGERVVPTGESKYGSYFILSCEVVEGEHEGDWASAFVNLNPNDRRFRAIYEVVTGADISKGGQGSWPQFEDQLLGSVFLAELGPERKKRREGDDQNYLRALDGGKTGEVAVGELYPTGYTAIKRLVERVGDYAGFVPAAAQAAPSVPAPDEGDYGTPDDDELPF